MELSQTIFIYATPLSIKYQVWLGASCTELKALSDLMIRHELVLDAASCIGTKDIFSPNEQCPTECNEINGRDMPH